MPQLSITDLKVKSEVAIMLHFQLCLGCYKYRTIGNAPLQSTYSGTSLLWTFWNPEFLAIFCSRGFPLSEVKLDQTRPVNWDQNFCPYYGGFFLLCL